MNMIAGVRLSTYYVGRAFCYAGPSAWNALILQQEDICMQLTNLRRFM